MRTYPSYFSFTNFGATATVTASSELGSSLATNVRTPGRPFLPWRTTTTGDQSVVLDFTTAKSVKLLLLIRANFTSARIQGNPTDSWGSPAFNQLITISRNPWNYRYQHGVRLTGFNYRYLRILIPSQTPTDASSGYLLGGVWAGGETRTPRHFRIEYEPETVEPKLDMVPEHQGWRQRLVMGDPLARFQFTRIATVNRYVPGYSDELATWKEIDRQIVDADIFAILLTTLENAQAFVVRPVADNKWTRRRHTLAEQEWSLEEVIGP